MKFIFAIFTLLCLSYGANAEDEVLLQNPLTLKSAVEDKIEKSDLVFEGESLGTRYLWLYERRFLSRPSFIGRQPGENILMLLIENFLANLDFLGSGRNWKALKIKVSKAFKGNIVSGDVLEFPCRLVRSSSGGPSCSVLSFEPGSKVLFFSRSSSNEFIFVTSTIPEPK